MSVQSGSMSLVLVGWILIAAGFVETKVAANPVTGAGPTQRQESNLPLVMENADRLEGFRNRGEYILSGNVRFRHGKLVLKTERAVWLREQNLIYCEQGMQIEHRGSTLTSDRGQYSKTLNQASAEGDVLARDSTGEYELTGQSLTYNRLSYRAAMMGEPVLKRFSQAQARVDSVAAPGSRSASAASIRKDTMVIVGNVLAFNDSSRVASAEGGVRITRAKMIIVCDSAEFHDRADSLYLYGRPKVELDGGNTIVGEVMRISLLGEELRSLLVKGGAEASSLELATDTSAARQSHVKGDSLFLVFREGGIDSMEVFRRASGNYYEVDRPQFVSDMSGDYMIVRFVDKQIRTANVLGKAKSIYYHFEKKKLKGRNVAEGDTIDLAFDAGRIADILIRGKAKGIYYGEQDLNLKAGQDSAGKDGSGFKGAKKDRPSSLGGAAGDAD